MAESKSILLQNGTLLVHDENDNLSILHETDLLIEDGKISKISTNIQPPLETEIIDCTSKIVSPGFVDTHHHVWQTQLKGRHSDDTLLDYHPKGNLQYYNYSPEDVFWGELGGLLEAISGGTTTIVDHAHMSKTADHVRAGLDATVVSGIRSVFCYSLVMNIASWDREGMVNAEMPVPAWWMPLLEELSRDERLVEKGRVDLGLGFDSYHLPEKQVKEVFEKARVAKLKLITSHWRRNNIAGMGFSVPKLLEDYGLLKPDILLSHATGSTDAEFALLKRNDVHISCTPATESQMAHGDLIGFRPDVLASLGSDCHSNNPSSILHAMHIGLAVARALRNHQMLQDGHFPKIIEPTTLQVFNLATVKGAQAMGMGESVGRLEIGRQADVLVFETQSPGMACAAEHDPLTAVVRHAETSDIEMVIVGGRVLKREGKLVDVDVGESDLRGWEGWERVREIVGNIRKLGWKQVRQELKRSREEIQKRIDGVSIELAKEKVLEMWGNKDGEGVLK